MDKDEIIKLAKEMAERLPILKTQQDLPRTETPWSKALAAALLQKEMTLGRARDVTGIGAARLSSLKNGQDQPTDEEREVLERVLELASLN